VIYRKLSLTHHPDKSRESNATETFRLLQKANEVLSNNESKALFDYYLDHPRNYFKVSGKHFYRNMPKSDWRLVVLLVLLLISWLVYTVQKQNYERLIGRIEKAILAYQPVKNGGPKQIQILFDSAYAEYTEHLKASKCMFCLASKSIAANRCDCLCLNIIC
jgi:curved DNA-binding protein CbpA